MKFWIRAKSATKSAYSTIKSEPKHLAPMLPFVEEALELLDKPFSIPALEQCQYVLEKAQNHVAKWRPAPSADPSFPYIQPQWAESADEQLDEALAMLRKIDVSTEASVETKSDYRMNIFISHSSKDKATAEAFVTLVRAAINIASKDIRCTSVDGYRLPAGANSDETLRAEVFGCEAFVGLLSPASMKSVYVTFELGARWGSNKYLAPIRIAGFKADELKAPLSAIHVADGTSETDMHQLMHDLAQRLNLVLESPAAYVRQLQSFVRSSSETARAETSNNTPAPDEPSGSSRQTHPSSRRGDAPANHDEYSNADNVIAGFCERKWPDDYSMQAYCINEQSEAVEILRGGRPSDIPEDVFIQTRRKAAQKWPDDYSMRVYTEAEQFSAYRNLKPKRR
jgi:hypothetical protein